MSVEQSRRFAARLRACGAARVREAYFERKSHTDAILEDPLGGSDPLMAALLKLVKHSAEDVSDTDIQGVSTYGLSPGRRLPKYVPSLLLRMARRVNPF